MPKRERTRESILSAYVAQLDTTNYDEVSVKALCEEAGIVRSTFYTYFTDIYEVIQTVEDELTSAFGRVDSLARAAEERSANVSFTTAHTDWGFPLQPPPGFCEWFDCCEEHATALRGMLGPHGDPYFEEKFRRLLEKHVVLLMDMDGMPNDDLRRGFLETMTETHILLVRNWLLHEETTLTKERIGVIVNSIRLGANTMGHFGDETNRMAMLCDMDGATR